MRGSRKVVGSDPLDAYLVDLRDADQLTRDDELELVCAIDAAWRDAFAVVVGAGISLPELIQLAEKLQSGRLASTALAHDAREERLARRVELEVLRAAECEERIADARTRLRARALVGDKRAKIRKALGLSLARRKKHLLALNLRRDHFGPMVERVYASLLHLRTLEERAERGERAARHDQRELLRELGLTKVAARKQRLELAELMRVAEAAKRKLVTANLRLVVSFAKKYGGRGVALGDLIQDGNISLMRAADKYDHRVGTKFSTYAAWWLRQAMQRAVISHGRTVRLPVHVAASRARAARKSHEMAQHLGRVPDATELAAELGETVTRVRETLEAGRVAVSIDAPISDDGRLKLADVMADERMRSPDDAVLETERKEYAEEALRKLSAREQRILRLRFGMDGSRPHTLSEIGKQLNLTRERIRQIEAVALRKLRRVMTVRAM